MDSSRRSIFAGLSNAVAGLVGITEATAAPPPTPPPGPRWAMVVDAAKCIGCQACTVSCIMENAVPEDSFRTIVSTYEVREAGGGVGMAMLPRLCNHCADAPCIPVCPVGATYQRPDGIVVVNADACVGCAYCVQACPYDARFINHTTQKADKCTFCAHRVDAGLLPACVETCVGGARIFGDLNDPASSVSRILAETPAKVLKPEMHTAPHVFYLGLDDLFLGRVEAEPTLWQPQHGQPQHGAEVRS
ncbi:4Fe-4S dicluster domain-containing protein [Roseococcus sp. SDR]|uniref:sulfate reduction electron transfer complex DsrMKJOP subunit DsrO n=1 Tax=Roseococcus sp. SDR TaxID=2835532 RepID=UPI001BCB8879|nr:4Fe-4S dicluster domain-containing protein [Roseococcus sp. SDR]MBS7791464.1 4Fe-4S dicluster domain-containing protein [Roseococcus sp. SDR]MBV1846778.1 4Fe-4S dicluster domain-containing protein [Roseococcus sp. SDR]